MKIENISNKIEDTCNCGSWLEHWYKFSNEKINHCQASACTEPVKYGAHVQKADSHDRNWYIVPLCKSHSKSTYHVDLIAGTQLVSVDLTETCG